MILLLELKFEDMFGIDHKKWNQPGYYFKKFESLKANKSKSSAIPHVALVLVTTFGQYIQTLVRCVFLNSYFVRSVSCLLRILSLSSGNQEEDWRVGGEHCYFDLLVGNLGQMIYQIVYLASSCVRVVLHRVVIVENA